MNHLQVREYYGVKRARASSRVESFPFMEGVPGLVVVNCRDAAVP